MKCINEPHVGGGNPVSAIGESLGDVIFNDILGTSLGVAKDDGYSAIDKTSFGADSTDKTSFFTGKPYVEDLGYAFLFRNYRADLGKWQMRDLIGYPDGWNNLAYCGNSVVFKIDILGCDSYLITIHVDGGAGGGSSSSGGSGNSFTSGFGHGWTTISHIDSEGNTTKTTRGFYPIETPGLGAVWGERL